MYELSSSNSLRKILFVLILLSLSGCNPSLSEDEKRARDFDKAKQAYDKATLEYIEARKEQERIKAEADEVLNRVFGPLHRENK